MILFREEHVAPILAGRKTQTRRGGKRRWNVGAVHACYTRPPFAKGGAEPFCRVHIVDVRRSVSIASMSQEDVNAEGYETWQELWGAWCAINGGGSSATAMPWVIEFEVAA